MSVLTHSTTSKTIWGFDPTTIPDCDIWFDGADTTTIRTAGASVVQTWRNKGSLDMFARINTGSVQYGFVGTINGNNFLRIPAGAQLSFQCAISSSTSRTWFIVMRGQTQINTSQFFGPINVSTSAQDAVILTRNGNTTYTIYESPNGNGTNFMASTTIPNPFSTTSLYSLVHSSTAANNVISVNGTEYARSSNGAAGGYSTASLTYFIGTTSYNTAMDICEILHYDRDLTPDERKAVEGYLMWKWGIKLQNETTFTPTSIGGCQVWYDANVDYNNATSRATNFTFSSGDSVNVWLDKSGFGRNATFYNVSPSTARPILTANQVSGKTAVVFNGTNVLNSTLTIPPTLNITVFLVAASTSLSAFRAAISLNANPGNRGSMLTIYQSSGNIWWFSGGNASTDGNTAGIVVASGRYDILANYWSTSLRTQMNVNGHFIASSTSSPSALTNNATMFIGGTTSAVANSTTPAELWAGGICEIIVYNSLLTTDERNRVERYLSLKWNRPLVNACAIGHPNKWVPSFSRSFVPTDISGCRFWIDAADDATVTLTGGTVSGVLDKSGNGNNLTGGTGFTWKQTLFNGTYPSFFNSSTSSVVGTNGSFSLAQPMTIFFAGGLTTPSSGFNNLIDSTNSGNRVNVYYWNTPPLVFRLFSGNAATPLSGNASGGLFVDSVVVNGTSSELWEDGVRIASAGNPGSQGFTGISVGNRWNFSSTPEGFLGHICEVIIYNRVLTNGERQKIERYLASRWGLQSSMSQTVPSYYGTGVTDVVNFVPTQLSDCRLWLDANDSDLFNTFGVTDGQTITTWRDKATNLVVNAQGSPVWRVAGLNGRPAVDVSTGGFTGSLPSPLTNYRQTTFIVSLLTSYPTDGYNAMFYATGVPPAAYGLAMRIVDHVATGTLFRSVGFFGSTYIASTARAPLNTPFLWTVNYTGTTPLNVFRNSSELTGTVSTPLGATQNAVFFGISRDPNGVPGVNMWTGRISEIITYGRVLTAAEQVQVEKYLARKWNITQLTLAANRFVNPAPNVATPRILPTTFTNIALWLDAADPDGDSIQPASGTSIYTWVDKSGNNKSAAQTVLSRYPVFTYSGIYPTIQFSGGTKSLRGPSGTHTSQAYGLFIVFEDFTPASGFKAVVTFLKQGGSSPSRYLTVASGGNGTSIIETYDSTTAAGKNSAPLANSTERRLFEAASNGAWGTGEAFYLNGSPLTTQVSGTSGTLPASDNFGFVVGGTFVGPATATPTETPRFDGNIYEIILITRLPTTQERQFIEGYLAWKWGLNPNLPSTHPYRKVSP